MGLCRHCVQVADALAASFFLLALRAYFHRSRLTIFPLLPDIQFSAVPSSNNKGAEKIIPHVDSGCFVWGRGRADCFPRPQCSLSKCSPLHGKGKGGKNYKLLRNLRGFVHPRRGEGPWAGGCSAQTPGRAGGLHCRALLGLSPGRMLNPGGMLRPGGMLNPGGMLSPEGASIGGRAPLRDGDTRGG